GQRRDDLQEGAPHPAGDFVVELPALRPQPEYREELELDVRDGGGEPDHPPQLEPSFPAGAGGRAWSARAVESFGLWLGNSRSRRTRSSAGCSNRTHRFAGRSGET